jgi:RNA polymerase sigma-70 factor, ECF subfamily
VTAILEARAAAILRRTMPVADDPSDHRASSLVEMARGGDEAAYAQLVDRLLPALHGLAFRILRDRDNADDAVQEALVAAWRDLPALRDPSRFEAWLHRLLVRACSRERARSTRRAYVDVSAAEDTHGSDRSAENLADRDEIERAFRSLSVDHRAIVVLARYHDLSTREIAELLGIPEGTVGSRLHNAQRVLRQVIGRGRSGAAAGRDA